MTRIDVALGARSYAVLIDHGLLDHPAEHLEPYARAGRLVIVSDETIWAAQGARLTAGLGAIEAVPVLVRPGEGSKSWDGLSTLIERLTALGIERGDHIVAFGGGVVGDLAGFAAAILNRGCPFVQIPTTLLAQVDSSVGGKTGINTPSGKNLVGAFHQPVLVLIDPGCLTTLDSRQMRAGYAEIVKYALIEDAAFFAWLEENGPALLAGNREALQHAIATSVAGKARIVAEDERETGGRRILLNLGHTFAHALETETGYSDRLLHGEAVAVGLVLAFELSAWRGFCPAEDAVRVRAHLRAAGLPTTLVETGISASGDRLVAHMGSDKKKSAGRLQFVLTHAIGRAFVDGGVELAEVARLLDAR